MCVLSYIYRLHVFVKLLCIELYCLTLQCLVFVWHTFEPVTCGNWPIWIGLNLNVSYRINMERICITMVAIEREPFGNYGEINRLKVRTQQFT